MIVGSTDQKLVVNVGKDIAGVQTAKIGYIKPDEVAGAFVATVQDEGEGIIEYQIDNVTDIDVAGDWVFYAEINYFDGRVGYGTPFVITAKNKGQL